MRGPELDYDITPGTSGPPPVAAPGKGILKQLLPQRLPKTSDRHRPTPLAKRLPTPLAYIWL
eukprot:1606627-Amphidinium_carterae.1